jgi:hypothetical protein
MNKRYAIIENTTRSPLAMVQRYLPSNYTASMQGEAILIEGVDSHGWTLDGYVIERLASGMIYAKEIFPNEVE